MPFLDRLWFSLLVIPGVSLERGLAYVAAAGAAWVCLYFVFARWLVNRRISTKPLPARQMGLEIACWLRSLAVYGVFGGVIAFAYLSGWTPMYLRIDQHGWTWFVISVVLSILVHDTYFYWTHRLMHHPRLFRLMHRTHHLS